MNKKIIKEYKILKELSTFNKKNINESILDDIQKFFSTASDEILNSEPAKKLKQFFAGIIPGLDDSHTIISSSSTDDEIYHEILNCIGAPITKNNMAFFYAWRQAEGGEAKNNPFNTTRKFEGATKYGDNPDGVKNYETTEDGIRATCETLKLPYYTDIVNGLKNDVGLYELSRMSSIKTWGTGSLLADVADGYLDGSTPKPHAINKDYSV
jgi:hypothetical protein